MAIKINWIVVLGISTIIFLNSCGKNGLGCANTTYNFQIGVKAYPDRDSIFVGDTLWLKINGPTSLKDIESNRIVDYSGAENLGSAIGFAKLISNNNAIDAANSFNYYLIKGVNVSNPYINKVREYLFSESNNKYVFQLGIIPKEKGGFKVFVGSSANVYRKNDKFTKAYFKINFEDTNQHLYFNKIIAPDVDLQPGTGVYLFKVY